MLNFDIPASEVMVISAGNLCDKIISVALNSLIELPGGDNLGIMPLKRAVRSTFPLSVEWFRPHTVLLL